MGIQLEVPLHDFARAAWKLRSSLFRRRRRPLARSDLADLLPLSRPSFSLFFPFKSPVLSRSGLCGGTMTVIRSVFVPDDGWLRRAPGRPSPHLRHSNLELSALLSRPTSSLTPASLNSTQPAAPCPQSPARNGFRLSSSSFFIRVTTTRTPLLLLLSPISLEDYTGLYRLGRTR